MKGKKYVCPVCGLEFDSQRSYAAHMKRHKNEEKKKQQAEAKAAKKDDDDDDELLKLLTSSNSNSQAQPQAQPATVSPPQAPVTTLPPPGWVNTAATVPVVRPQYYQPPQSTNTNDDFISKLIAFLSTPVGAKIAEKFLGEDKDPLKDLIYQKMMEDFMKTHDAGQRLLDLLPNTTSRAYGEGLKEYLKSKYKKIGEAEAEKFIQNSSNDPLLLLAQYIDQRLDEIEKRLKKKKKKAETTSATEQAQTQPANIPNNNMNNTQGGGSEGVFLA